MNLNIIYEDQNLIMIIKILIEFMHQSAGNISNTMVNGLLHHCRGKLSALEDFIRNSSQELTK